MYIYFYLFTEGDRDFLNIFYVLYFLWEIFILKYLNTGLILMDFLDKKLINNSKNKIIDKPLFDIETNKIISFKEFYSKSYPLFKNIFNIKYKVFDL